jgi:hypothetical protein
MTSDTISFPVYVVAKDCGEVTAFTSFERMQGHFEAIDVENNEYEAWDAYGRLLQLRVGPGRSEWLQISRTDRLLSEKDFTEVRGKAMPYRDSEPFLRSIGRRLGLLKADD